MLLIHRDDDRNVPFQQTTVLIEKLRAQNVSFEELIIPDEIHDLLRWSDWVRDCQILRWQIGCLGPTAISPLRSQSNQRRVPHVSINPEGFCG